MSRLSRRSIGSRRSIASRSGAVLKKLLFAAAVLVVSVAGLGVIGTVMIAAMFESVDDARQTGTKIKLDSVKTIVQQYQRDCGDLPRDLPELAVPDPRHGNCPWLTADDLRDTWGNPMMIKLGELADAFEIVSFGADGVENGFGFELGYDRDLSSDRPLVNDDA